MPPITDDGYLSQSNHSRLLWRVWQRAASYNDWSQPGVVFPVESMILCSVRCLSFVYMVNFSSAPASSAKNRCCLAKLKSRTFCINMVKPTWNDLEGLYKNGHGLSADKNKGRSIFLFFCSKGMVWLLAAKVNQLSLSQFLAIFKQKDNKALWSSP